MSRIRSVVALCALSLYAGGLSAQSSTPAVSSLFAFNVSNPTGNLALGADGAVYGIASPATSTAGGLIYRATVDGSSIDTVVQIEREQAMQPVAGLTLASDGQFYGTTRFGSIEEASTTGTVYRLSPAGDFAVIHRFAAATASNADFSPINTDGAYPEAELIEGPDGYLYGVASAGGQFGTGAVFKLKRDGSDFQRLHEFAADTDTTTVGLIRTVDGAAPRGKLVQGPDGTLFGTASVGGDNGRGTVFRIAPDGTAFTVLYHFSATTADPTTGLLENTDGAIPLAGLTDGGDGFYYGVTSAGGTEGRGVIFRISPDGATFQVLHQFDGPNGSRPTVELTLGSDGRLYGTTEGGGVNASDATSTLGTIFSIDVAGTNFARLYSFDGTVGSGPRSSLLELGSADFLGTAGSNGRCGYGSLYRYKGDGTTFEGTDDRCGRRRNDQGGGSGGPALLLVLGSIAWLRRRAR
jgi:uncharacterized repeat protein (TIGR03803 family)